MMIPLIPLNTLILLCLDTIIKNHLSPEDHMVVLDADLGLSFPQILISSDVEMVTKPLLRQPDLYVADLEEMTLNETLVNFQGKTTFNPRAKFVFLGRDVKEEDIDTLSGNFISNVIFIEKSSGEISTYYPYKNKDIHDMNKEVFVINNCSNLIENDSKNDNLFQREIPKFWNNSMATFCYLLEPPYAIGPEEESKGINLDIFGFVASLIQLKPFWKSLTFPDNGDLTAYTLDSVSPNKGCDLTSELYPSEGIDFTHPHVYDELPFFVPTPAQIPRWQYLLKSLTIEIWMFWIFTCVLLSICWGFVFLVLEKRWDLLKMLEMLWLNVEYFIEKSHDVSMRHLSLRVLFLLIVLQSFFLNMIFKCNFNLVLNGIIFEKPISSFEDIVDRKMVFGLFQVNEEMGNILQLVGGAREEVLFVPCNSSTSCFNRAAFERDMAVHQSVRTFKYHLNDFLDEDGSPLLFKLEPPYRECGLGAVLPLGHPLTPTMDEYILKLHAYGLIEFFVDKYDRAVDNKLLFKLSLTKLTLEHIMAPSAMLIGGYVVGVALFLLEVRRNYMNKKTLLFLKH